MIDSLPARELGRVEISRIREHEDVVSLSALGSHDMELTNGLLLALSSGTLLALHLDERERGWRLVSHGDLQDPDSARDVIEELFAITDAPPEDRERAVSAFHDTAMGWRDFL